MSACDRHSARDSASDDIRWVRSSRCAGTGSCLEATRGPDDAVWVRDGKDPGGRMLVFTRDQWRDFVNGVAAGRLGAS
jgi:uncharacterized protein DUF397